MAIGSDAAASGNSTETCNAGMKICVVSEASSSVTAASSHFSCWRSCWPPRRKRTTSDATARMHAAKKEMVNGQPRRILIFPVSAWIPAGFGSGAVLVGSSEAMAPSSAANPNRPTGHHHRRLSSRPSGKISGRRTSNSPKRTIQVTWLNQYSHSPPGSPG